MKNILRKKSVVVLLIALLLTVFVRNVPQISLVERAIVLCTGIDYDKKEDEFEVSLQIAKPSSGSKESGSKEMAYGIVSEKGKTIGEALDRITHKIGLIVSLSQCNVLVVGNDMLNKNVFPAVNYLITTWQIPEQAVIAGTDKKAKDILETKLIMNAISGFQIRDVIMFQLDFSSTTHTSVKEFIIQYMSDSKAAIIPYLTKYEVPKDDSGDVNNPNDTKYEEIDYRQSVIVAENSTPLLLTPNDTRAVNFVKTRPRHGSIHINIDDVKIALSLVESKNKCDIKLKNGKADVKYKIHLDYIISETEFMKEYFTENDIPQEKIEEMDRKVGEIIKKQIIETYKKCSIANMDVFNLYNIIYYSQGLKWKAVAGDGDKPYLDKIKFDVEMEIDITRE